MLPKRTIKRVVPGMDRAAEEAKYQPGDPPLPPGDAIISPDTLRENRLPPGQARSRKWPVLNAFGPPEIDLDEWRLHLFGLVEAPVELTLKQFGELPRVKVFADMHCVTRWSRLGNTWEGVPVSELRKLVHVQPEATHVLAYGYDGGWTTNIPIEEFFQEDVLLADTHDGAPITIEHGGPVAWSFPGCTPGRAQSGSGVSNSSPATRRGSGRKAATTCTAIRGARSGSARAGGDRKGLLPAARAKPETASYNALAMELVRYKPGEAIRWLETGAESIRRSAKERGIEAVRPDSSRGAARAVGKSMVSAAGALVDLGKSAWADLLARQAEASEYVLQDRHFDVVRPGSIKSVEYDRVLKIELKGDKVLVLLDRGNVTIRPYAYIVAGKVRVPIGWSRNGMEVPYELLIEELAARCGVNLEHL